MRRLFLLVLVASVCLSGCAKNNIEQIAAVQQVELPTLYIDSEMQDVMTEVFTETNLAWDEDMVYDIKTSLTGLATEAEYIYSIVELTGTIPYQELVATTRRNLRLINKLKKDLDERAATEGAVTKVGKFAYEGLVERVLLEATRQKLKVSSISDSINKKADQADIADLKKLYQSVKPLVAMAKAGL